MADHRDIEEMKRRWQTFQGQLPGIVGTIGKNFFKRSFELSGWLDGTKLDRWEPRSARAPRPGRKLLVDTGNLRRSIRIVRRGRMMVVVGTDVPYAPAHNFGIDTTRSVNVRSHKRRARGKDSTVKAHSRMQVIKLPRRQFIGDSEALNKSIERAVMRHLARIL